MFNNKDRLFSFILIFALIFSLFTLYVYSDTTPSVSAKAAVLLEPETKSILYEKNKNARLPMASTTKIMTALIACESLDLEKNVLIDDSAIGIDGSSIYLTKGEIMRAEDLIYALMLNSANDAAVALAIEISGSIESFCDLMNQRSEELGAKNTHFTNPHGLDDKNHYTSAQDLALISAEALKNKTLKQIVSTQKKEIESSECTRVLTNHNKLLRQYDGCIGVKTGYTQKSGRSLVGAAEREDLTLISVTINAPDDWNDHKKLLDYGFSRIHAKVLLSEEELKTDLPILNANKSTVRLSFANPIKIIYEGTLPDIEREIKLNSYLIAPIKKGDKVGKLIFKSGEKLLASVDIVADESIEKATRRSFFNHKSSYISRGFLWKKYDFKNS